MKDADYAIGPARAADLCALAPIERAAAALLRGHAPSHLLDETTPIARFHGAYARGHLWVARCGARPVGFALVEMLAADAPHLEEIDVHPEHGHRGLGAALVRAVCDWAAGAGYRQLSLTTFRDVPWNMPFYARLGFEEIPAAERSAAIAAALAEEAARGFDPSRRVAMRRLLRGAHAGA